MKGSQLIESNGGATNPDETNGLLVQGIDGADCDLIEVAPDGLSPALSKSTSNALIVAC